MNFVLLEIDLSVGDHPRTIIDERDCALISLAKLDLETFHLDSCTLFNVESAALICVDLCNRCIWFVYLQVSAMTCEVSEPTLKCTAFVILGPFIIKSCTLLEVENCALFNLIATLVLIVLKD